MNKPLAMHKMNFSHLECMQETLPIEIIMMDKYLLRSNQIDEFGSVTEIYNRSGICGDKSESSAQNGFIVFVYVGSISLNYLDPVIVLNNFIFIGLNSGVFINQSALTFLTEFGMQPYC